MAQITGKQIVSIPVNRQDDTVNSQVTNARIECGWGYFPVASGTAGGNEFVTFQTPFTTRPIVTVVFGGDSTSATTYGSGAATLKACFARAISVQTNGFTALISTNDNSNYTQNGNIFYQWIAIGN